MVERRNDFKKHWKIVVRSCQAKRLTSDQKTFKIQETAQQKNLATIQSFPYAQHMDSSAIK